MLMGLTRENFFQTFADLLLSREARKAAENDPTHRAFVETSEGALVRYVNKRAHMSHEPEISVDARTYNLAEEEEEGAKEGEGDVLKEVGKLRERVSVMHEHLNFISSVRAYACSCICAYVKLERTRTQTYTHMCPRAPTHTHDTRT